MLARSVFITGSNRGLGLEFVKQLASSQTPPEVIIATCRNPKNAEELNELAKKSNNIEILKFDTKNEGEMKPISAKVKDLVGNKGLNLLINNAGISTKFSRLNLVKWEQMIENLVTNTISPLMLTKNLLPHLQKAAKLKDGNFLSVNRAAVINISSILGSIEGNDKGGFYPYRSSKAALNAIGKSMSLDLRSSNILVVNVHPGWAQTSMGGPQAPLSAEKSISTMLNLFSSLNEDHNGTFLQYTGEKIPY